MSTLAVPYNIQSHAAALAEGLSYNDRIHLGVTGNHSTDGAVFVKLMSSEQGVIVSVQGRPTNILWGDIIELWPLKEKPNIYCSDVPEVAEVLEKLKACVKKCVEANQSAGVLFLLDQVPGVKKAESLFKEAREIIAGIKF